MSHDASLYGAERGLLELVSALRMKRVQSFVILPRRGPLLHELMRLGVPCTIVRYYNWMGPRTSLWRRLGAVLLSAIAAIPVTLRLHKWRANLVCSNSVIIFTGALAAWISRKPHVLFIREFLEETYSVAPHLPLGLTMRLIDMWSRLILTNSEAVRQEFSKYLQKGKMHVAYPAALVSSPNHRQTVPFKDDAGLKCLTVGRLVYGKRCSDAIRAIGSLCKRGHMAQLAIVGSGSQKDSLEALVKAEGLQERVFFTGFSANPFAAMSAADVILICSRKEGFGRVTVEAMRFGKPVIAAASGGTLELVRDGFNGLLYTPGDHEELAERVLLLLLSPSLRMVLGENGRIWAQRFSLEAYGTTVVKRFCEALQRDTSPEIARQ